MMKTAQKGFTLIELAIVIVIVAVLAAVAVPKFSNVTRSAQAAVAKDLMAQITSAASIYTAERQATPRLFSDFVTPNPIAANAQHTLSLAQLGNAAAGPQSCTVGPTTITCTSGGANTRFPEIPAGGVIISLINPQGGIAGGNLQLRCGTNGPDWNAATCSNNAATAGG